VDRFRWRLSAMQKVKVSHNQTELLQMEHGTTPAITKRSRASVGIAG
jgi:hypothetical protein